MALALAVLGPERGRGWGGCRAADAIYLTQGPDGFLAVDAARCRGEVSAEGARGPAGGGGK